MRLSDAIGDVLEKHRDEFMIEMKFKKLSSLIKKMFRKYDVKVVEIRDVLDEYFAFGGEYDVEENYISITAYVPRSKKDTFRLNKSDWENFKFTLMQTLHHELVHQYQYVMREDLTWIRHYKIEAKGPMCKLEDRVYLSDKDEVDAYAHDLALEIKYYYPNKKLSEVFKNIKRKKCLSTYNLYNTAFRYTDWFNIRKVLLKKTYKWLV